MLTVTLKAETTKTQIITNIYNKKGKVRNI